MQFSFIKLTGAFRHLCVRHHSYRVPPLVSCLSPRVAPSDPSPLTASLGRYHCALSFSSARTADILDQPPDANADVSGLHDEFRALVRHDVKSTSKGSRPSSASTQVLDDSQHWINASLLPAYAWPFLTKLRLAGKDKAQADLHLSVQHESSRAGHDVFVVGGTVRDLLLDQQPKDLDLVTTATLQQV